MRRIVVAGAGLAGLRAAEELRSCGFEGELTIAGDERHRPYNRPPLSKQLLAGTMEVAELEFVSDDLDVTWALGAGATSLDPERRAVTLADGAELPYDGLVIATGRRARELPGLPELEGFFMLRTVDDSLALRAAVDEGARVAIVGAGFVGCEVAATLRGRGVPVTVIEAAPYPMPVLGVDAGRVAMSIHAQRGVDLRLGVTVEGFDGNGRVEAVRLAGGETVDADVVLIAIGSVPNTEWLEGSGLELCQGAVSCDEACVVRGYDDIVAAGDVAAWIHPHAPGPVWVEHWTHASEMGRAAARNLLAGASEREAFTPVPTFWSDQYDLKIKSAGLLGQATTRQVVEHDDAGHLVVEGHRDGDLVGAVLFNRNKAFIDYRRKLAGTLVRQPA